MKSKDVIPGHNATFFFSHDPLRSPKKTSERKTKDPATGKPDVIHFSDKDPLVTSLPTNGREPAAKTEPAAGVKPFAGVGVPRIPRATAAGAWDGETALEMTPSNSRHGSVAQGRTLVSIGVDSKGRARRTAASRICG